MGSSTKGKRTLRRARELALLAGVRKSERASKLDAGS